MARKTTNENAPLAEDTPNPLAAAVDALLEQARDLRTEKEALYVRIDASRTMLRNMVKMDNVTPEQADEIEDLYPARQRREDNDDETRDEALVDDAPTDEVVA